MNQLNSFDERITQFTFEKEEENALTFLDIKIIRNTNDLFAKNQQIQTFTLTGIHIHHYSGRKQQLSH